MNIIKLEKTYKKNVIYRSVCTNNIIIVNTAVCKVLLNVFLKKKNKHCKLQYYW